MAIKKSVSLPSNESKPKTNNNYKRGVAFERSIMKQLTERGYYCSRTSGSHGKFDCICINDKEILLIQAKTTRSKNRNFSKEIAEFKSLVVPENVRCQLWIRNGRKTEIIEISA